MTQHGAITLNAWIEIVVIGLLVANVFNLLGFIATSWAVPSDIPIQIDYEGLGLWRYCQKDPETTGLVCYNLAGQSGLPGWFMVVQALICIAFICFVSSFITILLYACAQVCHQSKCALTFSIIAIYMGVLFDLIGITIFGVQIGNAEFIQPHGEQITGFKTSWCFILCTIAMVIYTLIGTLVVFELLTLPTNPYIKDDFESEAQSGGGEVIGGSGGANILGEDGSFPGGTIEIQMNQDEGIRELAMEDPGLKSISMA